MAEAQNEPVSYGEYDIERLLGKGSIGKVYLARHRRIGRRVALKIIRPEHRFDDEADRVEFRRRLQREAELCASLHHPNVVTPTGGAAGGRSRSRSASASAADG